METKETTCAERIAGELESLESECAEVMEKYYSGDDDGMETWNEFPLAVSTRQETKIELSWGGPSSFLTVSHDGADVYSVTFHFQDWFDGARMDVYQGSKVWEYARSVIELRHECA